MRVYGPMEDVPTEVNGSNIILEMLTNQEINFYQKLVEDKLISGAKPENRTIALPV